MKYVYTAFFVLLFSLAGTAQAADRTWTGNGANQQASDAKNWNGETLPVSGDSLNFGSGDVAIWDLAGVVPVSVISGANLTLQQPLSTTGNLTLWSGTLDTSGQALNVGGSFNIEGGRFSPGASAVTVSGNWTFLDGDVLLAASTVTFAGNSAKTIASGGKHFGNVRLNAADPAGGASLLDDLYVDGTLSILDGDFSVGSRTVTVTGAVTISGYSSSMSVGSGKIVFTGTTGLPFVVSGGSFRPDVASTVDYRPVSGTITVAPVVYGNLTLDGAAIFSLAGETKVAGTLTVGESATLVPSGNILIVPSGLIVNRGKITEGLIKAPATALSAVDAGGAPVASFNNSSGTVYVRLEAGDLNRNGAVAEMTSGIVLTTLTGDREAYTALETGLATGIFLTNGVVIHQGTTEKGNGQLEVGQNDLIFVNFADPVDATDAKTVQVSVALAGAVEAGMPQIVTSHKVGNFSAAVSASGTAYTTHITWNTDLVTSSSVSVSAPGEKTITAGSLDGVTLHDVAVNGLKRGVAYSYAVTSMTADGKSVTSAFKDFMVTLPGDRIMTDGSQAVYWYLNEKRNVFADFSTYDSWFPDFTGVVAIPGGQMADIPLGKNVPMRGGTYLIKIQSDPKVYAVEPFGVLRWVQTEDRALALYGNNWAQRVRDVDVSQFVSYTMGEPLADKESPENFFYQVGGELNAVVGTTARPFNDLARTVNNISIRFAAQVLPATVSGLSTGAAFTGYVPELNGVFMDGATQVIAPAFGAS